MAKFAVLLALALAIAAVAQYPQGVPPPAPAPGSNPLPGGRPLPQPEISRPEKSKKKKKQQQDSVLPTLTVDGRTLLNDGKKLVIHTEDGRWITMTLDTATKWTRAGGEIEPSKVIPQTTVRIEATQDDEANLTATSVELLKDVPPEEAKSAAAKTITDDDLTRPTILHDPDAPDRPVLRHQKPKPAITESPAADTKSAAADTKATPKSGSGEMDFTIDDSAAPPRRTFGSELLDRATDWTAHFMEGLPNYTVEQITTRYVQQSRSEDWQPQDMISAKVIYENGSEKYQDISLNGKKTNKNMMELGGQRTTGEFGSMLRGIFEPVRNTDFKFYRSAALHDADAVIYDFKVALPNSDWTIIVGGQTLRPAYSGSIWVDKKTAQVRRLEVQADNIPKDFPLDQVQTEIEYDEVSFGTQKFLVPTHAENLSCERGLPFCAKNTIDFRNYHRYTGESNVTFQ